ncbi:MAG TPA: GNAT family N-acetyltransferase [Candidatus Ozemobacteraceae bacterium]|nr:GNAT family N-acetyltransferase [Candidatus Ozemobacteraceae bacterium]HQG29090.1 GNAT family N-acetyltransferase [Candidatus Ozemobacteraceae bacterium]
MLLRLSHATIRPWRPQDAPSLARYANNRRIWAKLRDSFPHPYTHDHAVSYIEMAMSKKPETLFAICVEDEAVGGIGVIIRTDIERLSAELGYWLGEPFWGKGIVTEAVSAITGYAMRQFGLVRIYAMPFATNPASARVLEKAGYLLEGRMRRAVIKDGTVIDQLLYAFVGDEPRGRPRQ